MESWLIQLLDSAARLLHSGQVIRILRIDEDDVACFERGIGRALAGDRINSPVLPCRTTTFDVSGSPRTVQEQIAFIDMKNCVVVRICNEVGTEMQEQLCQALGSRVRIIRILRRYRGIDNVEIFARLTGCRIGIDCLWCGVEADAVLPPLSCAITRSKEGTPPPPAKIPSIETRRTTKSASRGIRRFIETSEH